MESHLLKALNQRTRLLVSVRNAQEVHAALAGGADVIDVKDPAAGALGAAARATLCDVLSQVAGRVPVSAALGELCQWRPNQAELPTQIRWAKLGLSEMALQANWWPTWQTAYEALPAAIDRVAVVYADWRTAKAPEPEDVVTHGIRLRCTTVLIDTFDKTRGDLLCHFSLEVLARLTSSIRRFGLPVALAGSLTKEAIRQVLPLQPDYIAIRSAACKGGRLGEVCRTRVQEISELIGDFAGTPTR